MLLGEFAPLTGALDEVRIDVRVAGGDEILAADPADVLGALAEVVVGMAEVLAHSDDGLRSGDVIITGAAIPAARVTGGEQVEVRVGPSTVSARIA